MGAFCCHGNQNFNPICPKTLCNLYPTLMMLHIKFDQHWPTGLRDKVSSELWQSDWRTRQIQYIQYKYGDFEGKVLYFCGVGAFFSIQWVVVFCLSWKFNSVGGCPPQKCSSVGILRQMGSCVLFVFKYKEEWEKNYSDSLEGGSPEKKWVMWVVGLTDNLIL